MGYMAGLANIFNWHSQYNIERERSLEKMVKTIRYYAYARNQWKQIEQLLIQRFIVKGKLIKLQNWTGKVYKSIEEANRDIIKLNCN